MGWINDEYVIEEGHLFDTDKEFEERIKRMRQEREEYQKEKFRERRIAQQLIHEEWRNCNHELYPIGFEQSVDVHYNVTERITYICSKCGCEKEVDSGSGTYKWTIGDGMFFGREAD